MRTVRRIYWEKATLIGDRFILLTIEYDEALKANFDPIVNHIATTVKLPAAK